MKKASILTVFLSIGISVFSQTITDIDGNVYKTVSIGNNKWMAEDLRTTKYNDGTAINLIEDEEEWSNTNEGAYCWYNNDISYKNSHALYNHYSVQTNKLCPAGWRVPTLDDVVLLWGSASRIEGRREPAKALKSSTAWKKDHHSPSCKCYKNSQGTNSLGFNAKPIGYRSNGGGFTPPNIQNAIYWTSTSKDNRGYTLWIISEQNTFGYEQGRLKYHSGNAVRCVQGSNETIPSNNNKNKNNNNSKNSLDIEIY